MSGWPCWTRSRSSRRWSAADARFAGRWWHWFFLGQTEKPAERVISADPDAWYGANRETMGEEAYADFRRAIHDPAAVHAMCEDYRAGLGHRPRARRSRSRGRTARRLPDARPVGDRRDDMEELYGDPLAIWRAWAADVRGARIDSGHHMAEEAPAELAAELAAFLAA